MTTTSLPRFLGLTCLFLAWSLPSSAQECGEWALLDHHPVPTWFQTLVHGNGRFVGSGLVSEDGVVWQVLEDPQLFNDVIWDGQRYLAVGPDDEVRSSRDGEVWNVAHMDLGVEAELRGLAWNGALYAAVGSAGTVSVSPDGTNWELAIAPTDRDLWGVTWGNGRFVAVGRDFTIITSTDGTNWERAVVPPPDQSDNAFLIDATWSGSTFVAVGSWGVTLTSPDGLVWTLAEDQGTCDAKVIWDGEQFVCLGNYSSCTPVDCEDGFFVSTSPNGSLWRRVTAEPLHLSWAGGLAYADGRTVVATWSGHIFTSSDLATWNRQSVETPREIGRVIWDGNRYLAAGKVDPDVGFNMYVTLSERQPDGAWRRLLEGSRFDFFLGVGDLTASEDRIVVVGLAFDLDRVAYILTTDSAAVSMVETVIEGIDTLYGVTWTGSHFIAVGTDGSIVHSPDGSEWVTAEPPITLDLTDVWASPDAVVAIGETGTVLASANGFSWTSAPTPTEEDLAEVAWGAGRWVAVGDGGTIVTSTNRTEWVLTPAGTAEDLRRVTWTGSEFLVIGGYTSSPVLVSSPDGVYWTKDTSGPWGAMAFAQTLPEWVSSNRQA